MSGGGFLDWIQNLLSSGGGQQQMAAAGPIPAAPQGAMPQAVPASILAQGNPLTGGGGGIDAGLAGLGQLGQNLALQFQRRPVGSAIQPGGSVQQAIAQSLALTRQQADDASIDALRRSDPRYANLPRQAVVALASRPTGRPATDAEIARARVTPNGMDGRPLPWQIDNNGNLTLPQHDPNVAASVAQAQSDQRIYPWTAGGGLATGAAIRGGAAPGDLPLASLPGGAAPGPGVGGARPQLPMAPAQAANLTAIGGDPLAYVGGPHDPYRNWQPGQPDLPVIAQAPTGTSRSAAGAPSPGQGRAGLTAIAPGVMADTRPAPGTQEGQREGREGTLTADRTGTMATQAETAARQVPIVQRQLQLLDRGLQTGSMADTRSAIAGAIRTMAGDNATLRGFADAIMNPDEAAFRAATGELVLARAGGSLGPGVSNSDAIRFDQLAPQIRTDPAAAREVAQILLRTSIANARDLHEAYSASSRNYDPRTDPTTNLLRIMGRRYGVDFLTPDQGSQQGPPQSGMTAPATPAIPSPAGGAPPMPVTPAGIAIPGGRVQPMPAAPAAAGPPLPRQAGPRTPAPTGTRENPARPRTIEDRNRLPPGTIYADPDGTIRERSR